MQNKGAIRLLIYTLILVTIYQLSFTFVVLKVKNDAKSYATERYNKLSNQGDYEQKVAFIDSLENHYLDSMRNQEVYNFLFIKKYTLKDCQDRQLNLGLDLQGGMNVMLQVSIPSLVKNLSNNSDDPAFNKAFDEALAEYNKGSTKDFITLFYDKYKKIAPDGLLSPIFLTKMKDQISYNSSNDEVIAALRENAQSAIDNSFNVLRTRIDRFGVTQPNIQKLEGQSGRILVELPGVKDEERVRRLLQQSASLEFYLTYESADVWPILQEVDKKLAVILNNPIDEKTQDTTSLLGVQDTTQAATDTAASLLADVQVDSTNIVSDTTEDAVTKSREENLKLHPLLGRIYPAVDQNQQLLPGPVIGYVMAEDTAAVNRLLAMPEVKAMLPQDLKLAWSVKPNPYFNGAPVFDLIALKLSDGKAALDGDVITNARHNFNANKGSAEVTMVMNASAAKKWAELTGQNIGKSIAIVLDGNVYSYPTVQSKITGGVSQITGNFTIEEAQDLANVLKSGKLPVKIKIVELNHVGPSLGKESIKAGLLSFIIAFFVVLIYMILYYNRAGWVADIALIANMFFIVGVLASLGAVLTLPGIAGIVLTIGMSVDANVIIYERIREELRAGKGIKKAVADGYDKAYSAIIDANVTTLLTGFILYIFGHGPIQGFATTLIIGIFTSLFSAIFITRIIFDKMLQKGKDIKFSFKWSENILKNTKINFLGKRKLFYFISGGLVLISLLSLMFRGLDLGVDFLGGRTYIIRFDQKVNTADISAILEKQFGSAEVKTFGTDNQIKFTTAYEINSDDPNIETEINHKLYEALKPYLGDIDYKTFTTDYIKSSQKVGPTIAEDIKRAATYSVIFALLVIFFYIFVRFKNWQFGLGATVALLHDSIIVLGIFSLFQKILPFSLEIDQAFIAAILTVVGYSVNDTVIIFDRIREYFKLHPKKDKFVTVNDALNSTLSRTLNTSMTTFFVLLVIFLFGGAVIRGFVFALLVGIIVGTYSSLFIASPITYDTLKKIDIKEKKEEQKQQAQKQEEQKEKIEKNLQETPEERAERLKREAKKKQQRRKKKNKK